MMRLRLSLLTVVMLLVAAPLLRAQLSKVAVVDFERAVVESVEGKKSSEKFNSTLQARQTDIEKRQKELDDQQKKLQTGARTLNDTAKAEIQRDIDRRTTELQRLNEDAQKDLQTLRDELLRPIAERATAILQKMAVEGEYTLIADVSNPQNNVVWFNPKNDLTADLIKRIDAETPAAGAAPKTPGTTAPGATRPATPPAAAPRTPVPTPTPRKP
jgi:Skp family chaperone for outer membrane proteins